MNFLGSVVSQRFRGKLWVNLGIDKALTSDSHDDEGVSRIAGINTLVAYFLRPRRAIALEEGESQRRVGSLTVPAASS